MLISGATVALFFLFDVLHLGKRCETRIPRNCKTLIDKRKVPYSYCMPILKDFLLLVGVLFLSFYRVTRQLPNKDKSHPVVILPKQEHKEFSNSSHCLWTDSSHSYTCKLGLLSQICPDLNAILHPGFMDVISRLPPPGGTTASDIFLTMLITTYHLSLCFSEDFHRFLPPYHRVDVVLDADYEEILGRRVSEIRDFLLWHLKLFFRKSHSDKRTLQIKKGSIGITFFVNWMTCVYARTDNPAWTTAAKETQHGSKENGDSEIDFVQFLNYLNYHMSSRHYNFMNGVPFSIKMSSPKEPGQWYENTNLEKPTRSPIGFLKLLKTGIVSNSKSAKLETGTPREKLKYKNSRERYEDVSDRVAGFEASYSSNHPRLRRYVSSEDKNVAKLQVSFKLENPTENGDGDGFQRHLISQLAKAMRIPVPSIQDLKISQGTEVSFTLSAFNDANNVMDDVSVVEAVDFLKAKIKFQQLQLKDLKGQPLMTAGKAYASLDESADYSLGILVILCITLLVLALLIITLIYLARRTSSIPKSSNTRNEAYRNLNFGRDSSQSVGKYSYDSGLWLGPGPEPNFTVPDAPYYRPPTVDQISSTPRPQTAVRTRLKKNWNVDERALSTIPDDFGRNYVEQEHSHR